MIKLNERFDGSTKKALSDLAGALINQERASIVVSPERDAPGYWFGSGNLSVGPDGALYLAGRYRNYGDSRTGLGEGERGKELAVLRSTDGGERFENILSLSKADLSLPGQPVLSIEGSHLHFHDHGVTLYVSTEKDGVGYPQGYEAFHKPGTGVWSIDTIEAESLEALAATAPRPCVASDVPEHLHIKDPFVFQSRGDTYLGFCTHPYTWASSNTGFSAQGETVVDAFPRGPAWDVAMARMTCYMPVPQVGRFAGGEQLYLGFYDGAECVRKLDEHPEAVKRPRGYSCEEIGGLAVATESALLQPERISSDYASFVSPWGTGCSRYVDVLVTGDRIYATWQQSQPDQSQALVMNVVSMEEVRSML